MKIVKFIYFIMNFLAFFGALIILVAGVGMCIGFWYIKHNFGVDMSASEIPMIFLGFFTCVTSCVACCGTKGKPHIFIILAACMVALGIGFVAISSQISANMKEWKDIVNRMIIKAMPDLDLSELDDYARRAAHRRHYHHHKVPATTPTTPTPTTSAEDAGDDMELAMDIPLEVVIVMQYFECCGKHGKEDFKLEANIKLPLPSFCCPKKKEKCEIEDAYKLGCEEALYEKFLIVKENVVFVCSICATILFVNAAFSLFFAVTILMQRVEQTEAVE